MGDHNSQWDPTGSGDLIIKVHKLKIICNTFLLLFMYSLPPTNMKKNHNDTLIKKSK